MLLRFLTALTVAAMVMVGTTAPGSALASVGVAAMSLTTAAERATVVAQACLSGQQARAAVQSGEAISMRKLSAAVGGQVLHPQLCRSGGRLVYRITILKGNEPIKLTVDAASGSILGF